MIAWTPILLYHAITKTPGDETAPFSVTPSAFNRQLDELLAAGYRCLTIGQFLAERESDGRLPGSTGGKAPDASRVAVITFDDGYADFASAALPALQARSLPCTLYVTTGWLEGASGRAPGPAHPMLSWTQLLEVAAAGVEIGAHSHTHRQLDTLSATSLREELSRPKDLLESALGRNIRDIAYPHGYHGPRVRHRAQEVGYDSGAAVRNRVSPIGEDRMRLSRLTVTASTTAAQFSAWLDPRRDARSGDRESLLTTGWRFYRRGRALLAGTGSDFT